MEIHIFLSVLCFTLSLIIYICLNIKEIGDAMDRVVICVIFSIVLCVCVINVYHLNSEVGLVEDTYTIIPYVEDTYVRSENNHEDSEDLVCYVKDSKVETLDIDNFDVLGTAEEPHVDFVIKSWGIFYDYSCVVYLPEDSIYLSE